MTCQICFENFDHFFLKPQQLSCAHTYCFKCVNKLVKCPTCNEQIIEIYQNNALLEFIPEPEDKEPKKEVNAIEKDAR